MRWWLVALAFMVLVLVPSAGATIQAVLQGPRDDLKLSELDDEGAGLTLVVTMDCQEAVRLAQETGSRLAVLWSTSDPTVVLTGPDALVVDLGEDAPAPSCAPNFKTSAHYGLQASLATPGLVPVQVQFKVSPELGSQLPLEPVPLDPAVAWANLTFAPVVDLRIESHAPEAAVDDDEGRARFDVTVTSLSNVDLRVDWDVGRRTSWVDSPDNEVPLPRGNLTTGSPALLVPRTMTGGPADSVEHLTYVPPPDGEGKDKFVLIGRPRVVLDESMAVTALESPIELRYQWKRGAVDVGVEVDPTAARVPREESPLPGLSMALVAMGLAAVRRRSL